MVKISSGECCLTNLWENDCKLSRTVFSCLKSWNFINYIYIFSHFLTALICSDIRIFPPFLTNLTSSDFLVDDKSYQQRGPYSAWKVLEAQGYLPETGSPLHLFAEHHLLLLWVSHFTVSAPACGSVWQRMCCHSAVWDPAFSFCKNPVSHCRKTSC